MNLPAPLAAALLCAPLALLGAVAAAQTPPAPAPPSRADSIIEAVHRSGAVPRCWNAFLRATPDAPSVHFRVRVEVAAAGAVRDVAVLDPAPAGLVSCVRNQVRRVTVAAGDAVTVVTHYGFAAGSPAPVPVAPPMPDAGAPAAAPPATR